ncbi:MAG TPA: GGDEF domain-containing protein, partial [Gemmataceae bacterium]|nr:GGDEF domain-containing protein [Gemmataceae bacterium]
ALGDADSIGRIGGEEFLVIARETNYEGAVKLAERIRSAVERTPILYMDQSISITVSIGFAVAEVGVPVDFLEMLKVAAAAVQHAKDAGRNCCEVRRLGQADDVPAVSPTSSSLP